MKINHSVDGCDLIKKDNAILLLSVDIAEVPFICELIDRIYASFIRSLLSHFENACMDTPTKELS